MTTPRGRRPPSQPVRPQDDPTETIERLVPKRQIHISHDDVLVVREVTPRLNPDALVPPPFRYRVRHNGEDAIGLVFTSFQHAASEADSVASRLDTRVIYVEDDIPYVLADYRPSPPKR